MLTRRSRSVFESPVSTRRRKVSSIWDPRPRAARIDWAPGLSTQRRAYAIARHSPPLPDLPPLSHPVRCCAEAEHALAFSQLAHVNGSVTGIKSFISKRCTAVLFMASRKKHNNQMLLLLGNMLFVHRLYKISSYTDLVSHFNMFEM